MTASLLLLVLIAAAAGFVALRARDGLGRRLASPLATGAALIMLGAALAGASHAIAPLLRAAPPSAAPAALDRRALLDSLAAATDDVEAFPFITALDARLGETGFTAEERTRIVEILATRGHDRPPEDESIEWARLATWAWQHGWLHDVEIVPGVVCAIARVETDATRPETVGEITVRARHRSLRHLETVAGTEGMITFRTRVEGVEMDGRALERVTPGDEIVTDVGPSRVTHRGGGRARFRAPSAPGRHQVVVSLSGTMTLGFASSDGAVEGDTLRWRERRTMEARVLDAMPEVIAMVSDPATGAALREAITIKPPRGFQDAPGLVLEPAGVGWTLRGYLVLRRLPAGLAAELVARVNGIEIAASPRGPLSERPTDGEHRTPIAVALDAPPDGPVDIVLVPRPPEPAHWLDAFYDRGGPVPIWTKPIELLDVPVTVVDDG